DAIEDRLRRPGPTGGVKAPPAGWGTEPLRLPTASAGPKELPAPRAGVGGHSDGSLRLGVRTDRPSGFLRAAVLRRSNLFGHGGSAIACSRARRLARGLGSAISQCNLPSGDVSSPSPVAKATVPHPYALARPQKGESA